MPNRWGKKSHYTYGCGPFECVICKKISVKAFGIGKTAALNKVKDWIEQNSEAGAATNALKELRDNINKVTDGWKSSVCGEVQGAISDLAEGLDVGCEAILLGPADPLADACAAVVTAVVETLASLLCGYIFDVIKNAIFGEVWDLIKKSLVYRR